MRREVPTVRIWPMSSKIEGFRELSIARVQEKYFLRRLPAQKGRFRYPSAGLNAAAGTVVLFQFQARIIASAVFLRDEKFERPIGGHAGELCFDVASICTFDPLDIETLRKVWPGIGALGHVKQLLNPAMYGKFKRRLKQIRQPEAVNH